MTDGPSIQREGNPVFYLFADTKSEEQTEGNERLGRARFENASISQDTGSPSTIVTRHRRQREQRSRSGCVSDSSMPF